MKKSRDFLTILSSKPEFPFHPPAQETTTLAVKECVTPESHLFSNGSNVLRRISLSGGRPTKALTPVGMVLRGKGSGHGAPHGAPLTGAG